MASLCFLDRCELPRSWRWERMGQHLVVLEALHDTSEARRHAYECGMGTPILGSCFWTRLDSSDSRLQTADQTTGLSLLFLSGSGLLFISAC